MSIYILDEIRIHVDANEMVGSTSFEPPEASTGTTNDVSGIAKTSGMEPTLGTAGRKET